MYKTGAAGIVWWLVGALSVAAADISVQNDNELRQALQNVQTGTTIRIAPGEYRGGYTVRGVSDLTITAADESSPPEFVGGSVAWHFSRCDRLTLRHLAIRGQSGNGINLDDGGLKEQLVPGITLEKLHVSDIGPRGNTDGIKRSGLTGFTIRECTIEGWGGEGIDCVGCHDGLITGCRLTGKTGFSQVTGVQMKGGSAGIVVEKCHFQHAGQRPLNLGGSTGAAFFRPPGAPYEARQLIARENVIEGSLCAAAFTGVDGAEFSRNTILYPEKWIFRILQENRGPGIASRRQVVVRDNAIVFRREAVQVDVNIGPETSPETFRFEGNRWFAEDRPEASRPKLPVEETHATWGRDPRTDGAPP